MVSTRPNRFALFDWFKEHGTHLVHPNDLIKFADQFRVGHVFGFEEIEGWTVLSDGKSQFRVKPQLLMPISPPHHWVGDNVEFLSGDKVRHGVVREVLWHYKNNTPIYLLSSEGKSISKRYFDSDLTAR